jgi:putative addiction module component (TIGR02574 family)
MTRAEQIVQQALELPEDDREWIVETLNKTVSSSEKASVDEAWIAEAKRRMDEIDEGKVQLIPGEEVMSRLRARFTR